MKRLIIVALSAALLTIACAPRAEEVAERGLEIAQELEGMVDVPEEGVPESPAEKEFVSWGALDLPAQFPEYPDGRIEKPFMWDEQEWYPKILGIEGSSIEAIEVYMQRAQDLGYSLQWEREVMGDEDLGWAVSLETDDANYSIIINYFEEENGIEDYILLILDYR